MPLGRGCVGIHLEVSSYPPWEGQEGEQMGPRGKARAGRAAVRRRFSHGQMCVVLFLTMFDYKIKEFHFF